MYKYKKIYIIGPVGSGKSTFAKKLSKKHKIKYYELDKVVWDDDHGNIRRTDEKIMEIFHNIIKQKSWVIEDIGRSKFKEGREEADIIYYIKLSKLKSYYRVTKRWIKQRLGKEEYNYQPIFKQLISSLSTAKSYYKKEKGRLESLEEFKDKVVFVTGKEINKILKN